MVVGSKADNEEDRDISFEKVQAWATKREIGTLETLIHILFSNRFTFLGCMEVSAQTGKGVRELLNGVLQKALSASVPSIQPLSPRIPGIPTLSLIASYLSAKDRVQKVVIQVLCSH